MRLLLDEHYSDRALGDPLREDGHDVRVAGADSELHGSRDDTLLRLAVIERRIIITADTGDFRKLLIQMAEFGEAHTGVLLVPNSIPNGAFGVLLRSIRRELHGTNPDDWINRCIWLRRPRN